MSIKQLEEMGIPATALVKELREAVKAHTVTTGEGGKTLKDPIAPTSAEVESLASKLLNGAHLAGVEVWVEKQLVALI